MISNSDLERRREVVLAGHTGDLETVRSALGESDPTVRSAALAAMVRLGELTPTMLDKALTDTDPTVRLRATTIAAGLDGRLTNLIDRLEDPDPQVAESAAFALGERPADDAIIAALSRTALEHSDSLCRESAVAALGSIGPLPGAESSEGAGSASAETVLAACEDKATVRRRAVLALAAFDGPGITEMLRKLTADRDLQVRQAAEDLLAIEEGEQL